MQEMKLAQSNEMGSARFLALHYTIHYKTLISFTVYIAISMVFLKICPSTK